jgi:hypothetical protein
VERVNDAEKIRSRTSTILCHYEERCSWHGLCRIATNAIQHRPCAKGVTLKSGEDHTLQEKRKGQVG